MPKTIYIKSDYNSHSGIDVTWIKTRQTLSIGGWYDGCVGIESQDITLREFFDRLGITEKDCKKAFKNEIMGVHQF